MTAKSNEILAVRDLLKMFASLAGAVIAIDALHTQSDTAQVITGRGADYVMTVEHASLCSCCWSWRVKESSLAQHPGLHRIGHLVPYPPGIAAGAAFWPGDIQHQLTGRR